MNQENTMGDPNLNVHSDGNAGQVIDKLRVFARRGAIYRDTDKFGPTLTAAADLIEAQAARITELEAENKRLRLAQRGMSRHIVQHGNWAMPGDQEADRG
jgi:hypothetical protein